MFLKLEEALESLDSLDSDEIDVENNVLLPDASELTDKYQGDKNVVNADENNVNDVTGCYDESKFSISGNQSSAYVRRCTHEEFSPQCLKPTVKYPTKVMVWGCMSSHGVGSLYIINGTVKAIDYIEILQNKLLPTARDLFGNQSWIFQDDNAPCHRAKLVQKWLKDHTVKILNWSGQSPNLNPIENL
ncbi:transposable element Tcb1 transposase [Trichonephila clavipes]|nr:transposable element Tcb1 transposase [Trichonephila clavipes]